MKFGKLSLAAVVAMSATSVFAASNLEEAFKEGTYGGQAVVWYQTQDNVQNAGAVKQLGGSGTSLQGNGGSLYLGTDKGNLFSKQSSIGNAGLELNMKTAPLMGITAAATFYHVDTLGLEKWLVDGVAQTPASADWKADGHVGSANGGSWLGEAYLKYDNGMVDVAAGRMKLATPLVNSDTWNVFPNTFEAAVAHVKLPSLVLAAAYVTSEHKTMADVSSDSTVLHGTGSYAANVPNGGFSKFLGADYAYMLAAIAPKIAGTDLNAKAFYYGVEKLAGAKNANALYVDADYKMGIVKAEAQYISITNDNATGASTTTTANKDKTNSAYGIRVSADLGMVAVSGAYTSTDKKDNGLLIANFGDSQTKTPLYTATVTGDGDVAGALDTQAYKVDATVKTPIDGLKVTAAYAGYAHGSAYSSVDVKDKTSTSLELSANYQASKNLNVALYYFNTKHYLGAYKYQTGNQVSGNVSSDPEQSLNTVRAVIRYSFSNK